MHALMGTCYCLRTPNKSASLNSVNSSPSSLIMIAAILGQQHRVALLHTRSDRLAVPVSSAAAHTHYHGLIQLGLTRLGQ